MQDSLGSTYDESLGPAATVGTPESALHHSSSLHVFQWADSVKYTSGYGWSKALHYVDANGEQVSQLSFGAQDSMTLDDIPRLVQAQQTREQRPNASKYARQPMIPQEPKPRPEQRRH